MDSDYTTTVSIRMPLSLVQELDAMSKNSKFVLPNCEKVFSDRSDAIKSLVSIGIFLEKNKQQLHDPEFVAQMNDMVKKEKYGEWLNSMSEAQLRGFQGLIRERLDGRQVRINR